MAENEGGTQGGWTSFASRKITEAVEAKGATVESLEWEPIHGGPEMAGPGGGWTVFARWPNGEEDHALGLDWTEVVSFIGLHWEGPTGG